MRRTWRLCKPVDCRKVMADDGILAASTYRCGVSCVMIDEFLN